MSELAKRTFWRTNEDGLLEEVDKVTGQIIKAERINEKCPPNFARYEPWILDIICERLASGVPLTKICSDKHMPSYATFCRWRREHAEVMEAYNFALADRADALRDKAVTTAEKAKESGHERLKVETYKWAAQVDNPSQYNTTRKTENHVGITQIVIETGIRREGDEGYFKDESLKVREVKEVGKADTTVHDNNSTADSGGNTTKD